MNPGERREATGVRLARRACLLDAARAGLVRRPLLCVAVAVAFSSCGETTTVDPPVATTVLVTPAAVSMAALDETEQLAAEVRDQHGLPISSASVTWASSDPTVARVSASGLVTSAGNGTATATATAGSATGTAAVAVEQVLAVLLPSPLSVEFTAIGDTATLAVQAADANGHPMNLSLTDVTWRSLNEDVATVSAAGLVTAVANGNAEISASSGSAGGRATVTVRQEAATLTAAFDTASVARSGGLARFAGTDSLLMAALDVGVDLLAAGADANGHALDNAAVAWSSSQPQVAAIDSTGRVTSLARGTARLTASLGSQTASVWLRVQQEPAALAVSPDTVAFTEFGATQRLGVEVADANGHAIDQHSVRATWSSSQEDVATVNASGVVTAVYNGTATITATWGELSGTATVLVEVNLGREILTTFYQATGGDDWSNNANWMSDRPLGEWWGVTTDSDGWVTRLDLDQNGLRDTLPGELGGLTRLVRLSIYDHRLTGPIPPELGNLERLEWLNLSGSWRDEGGLSGPLPSELRRLVRLERLLLSYNRLTGPLPEWLADLDRLHTLEAHGNRLSGPIPASIGDMKALRHLLVSSNWLTGPIPPELGRLDRLETLQLEVNRLTGPIPPELGRLERLEKLSLTVNRLTGEIPVDLAGLTGLRQLRLAGNLLTGTIPQELGSLLGLSYLDLAGNRLTGHIPPELSDLGGLTWLHLYDNQLTGPIPAELGRLSAVRQVNLRGNSLTGGIPSELGDLEALQGLNLSGNELTGEIPAELGDLSALEHLYLHGNDLSGEIPAELGDLSRLTRLYLNTNVRLRGRLPRTFLQLGNLQQLYWYGTGACAPSDSEFQSWLAALVGQRGARC